MARSAGSRKTSKIFWNRRYNYRQGGTFEGVTAQLDYLKDLGVGAIWISLVFKNSKPDWEYNYHGYGIQDFLNVDARFSDGTLQTAEKELADLVDQAHARGIYVILDIVLNHAARVFDYVVGGGTAGTVQDEGLINAPLVCEGKEIQWLNGYGFPREDWENSLPAPSLLR